MAISKKISELDVLTSPQDLTKLFPPLFAQDGSPLNIRMSMAEVLKSATQVAINSGTLTGSSSPALSITQTWNNAATTFTGALINVTDTASNAASKLLDLQVGGSSKAYVQKNGMLRLNRGSNNVALELDFSGYGIGTNNNGEMVFVVGSNPRSIVGYNIMTSGYLGMGPTGSFDAFADIQLQRDAADRLALRRSTNAQRFAVYRTWSAADNFERGVMSWYDSSTNDGVAGTVLRIGTEKGTVGGTARSISFVTGGTERMSLATNGWLTVVAGGAISSPLFITSGSNSGLLIRTDTNPYIKLGASDDTGLTRTSAAVLKVTNGSTEFGQLDAKRTTLTGGTITASSQPLIDATQTWNDAAVNFTGFKQDITLTAANTNSLLFDWQVGGVSYLKLTQYGDLVGSSFTGTDFSVRLQNGGLKLGSASVVNWGSGNAAGTMDGGFYRAGAGLIGVTNGSTGPGTLAIDNVQGTNFERLKMEWDTNVARIGTSKGGSGTARDFAIITDNAVRVTFAAAGGQTAADGHNMAFGTSTGTKIGTATGQKIGFWNATPVVQQVLATGAGATVDNVITLLQTLGLCKQS